MYIPLIVSISSSLILRFSIASAAAIVHRNHFFVCTSRINLLNLKECSDLLVVVAKGFLKLPVVLGYANKTKESITSQNLGSLDFW